MKVRNLRKLVTILVIVWIGTLACTGCTKEPEDELQVLDRQEHMQEKAEQTSEQEEEHSLDTTEKVHEETNVEEAVSETVFVYVCGAVREPGVYELETGARVYEALGKAGGVREDAAVDAVNQARVISDGEQIYIPTEAEWKESPGMWTTQEDKSVPVDKSGKVDINTATAEELMTLNGIGDTRAQSILAYREANGPFQSIEELMNVEGIKEGVFAKIKDSIVVNAGS